MMLCQVAREALLRLPGLLSLVTQRSIQIPGDSGRNLGVLATLECITAAADIRKKKEAKYEGFYWRRAIVERRIW